MFHFLIWFINMKKILFLLSVLVFVATLFIGCPPHINPPKPPEKDTTNTPVTIIIPPEDSLYNYVPEAYLKNYFPFDTGTKFLFVYDGEDRVDSLVLTLQFNEIEHYFHMNGFLSPKQNKELSDDINNDTCYYWYDYEVVDYGVRYSNLDIDFYITTNPMKDSTWSSVLYFVNNPYSPIDSGGGDCECDCKECVLETCFPNELKLSQDNDKDKLYVVIEQGKGVTQFLGENDKMWRLDSIIK